ncbi:MAG: glycerophosphodiester phosphodiesterase [Planctomycetota bacterium]
MAAHRGDSRHFAENTLAAFRRATELGVAVQEFDVRQLADGELICMHDATFDRTTDSALTLGPGALVAECTLGQVRQLNAAWPGSPSEPVPTLAEALAVMRPSTVPLIEHKAGAVDSYLAAIERAGGRHDTILQSFDWAFVAVAHRKAPWLALAALGPTREHAEVTQECAAAAVHAGAGMLHWRADQVDRQAVRICRQHGLLLCTYTTDAAIGWHGAAAIGVDVMCTNDPEGMALALNDVTEDGLPQAHHSRRPNPPTSA